MQQEFIFHLIRSSSNQKEFLNAAHKGLFIIQSISKTEFLHLLLTKPFQIKLLDYAVTPEILAVIETILEK